MGDTKARSLKIIGIQNETNGSLSITVTAQNMIDVEIVDLLAATIQKVLAAS